VRLSLLPALTGALFAALLLCPGAGRSQSVQSVLAPAYPIKPIRLVVPYPPGGATDVIGRVIAQRLATELGQQVLVDNRSGGGGSVGAGMVANGPADGHTLLMGALTSHAINAVLFGKTVPFDIENSFAPIAIVGVVPLVVVAHPDLQATNLTELIRLARANPGGVSYGSAGNGSPQHLAGELFQRLAGIRLRHVPYNGGGPAMAGLLAGQVQSMFETAPAVQPHIRTGKLRALATATREPLTMLPGVPTAAASGLDGFEVSSLFGIVAPAGTPDAVVAKLSGALKTIMAMPDVKDTLRVEGAIPSWTTVAEAETAFRDESIKWKKLIKEVGLPIE
jgi:tripartite-type tricarboxylate transporter receptor subunit TctC